MTLKAKFPHGNKFSKELVTALISNRLNRAAEATKPELSDLVLSSVWVDLIYCPVRIFQAAQCQGCG